MAAAEEARSPAEPEVTSEASRPHDEEGAKRLWPEVTPDDRLTMRIARAKVYLKEHLKEGSDFQQNWYSKKASKYKSWSQWLSFIVISAGVLVTFVQVFDGTITELGLPLAVPVLTAFLGVIVTLAKGLERIGKFEETWLGYRKASEQMKREYRLYINAAGDYRIDGAMRNPGVWAQAAACSSAS